MLDVKVEAKPALEDHTWGKQTLIQASLQGTRAMMQSEL